MMNNSNNSRSLASSSSNRFTPASSCFEDWMKLQEQDLSELLQGLSSSFNYNEKKEEVMKLLVEKGMKNFEKYVEERSRLAQDNPSAYFGAAWCSSLELPLLWLSGCRPSIYVRLVYALCGMQIHSQLSEFLDGASLRKGDLGDLSAAQLIKIDDLQRRTIRGEEMLSETLASLQEDIADHPIVEVASGKTGVLCESNSDVDDALRDHEHNVIGVYAEADKFRLNTLKELLNILSPAQAVEFLAASKKLHLCIHNWGKQRDHAQGFHA